MADRLKLTAVQKKADQSRFVHNSYGSNVFVYLAKFGAQFSFLVQIDVIMLYCI